MSKCILCNSDEAMVIGGLSCCDRCIPKLIRGGILILAVFWTIAKII